MWNGFQSKGENEIATFLSEIGIDYSYEFPIAVVDNGKVKVWYPDFYLKDYQVVIEYFGMYEHNENYRENAKHKKKIFQECGIWYVPIYKFSKNWKMYVLNNIMSHLEKKTKDMDYRIKSMEDKKSSGKFYDFVFEV